MPRLSLKDRTTGLRERLRASVATNTRVQVEATQVTLRRLVVAGWVVVTLNIVYVIWFWGLQLGTATAVNRLWIQLVGGAHATCGVLLIALMLVFRWLAKASPPGHSASLGLHVAMVFVFVSLGVGLSIADQLVAANTTMYALISLAIAMLSLMRPALSIVIFALVYAMVYFGLALTQTDPQLLIISRSHTFAATLVSLMASSLMWHQYVQSTLLAWEVQRTQIALTAKQVELEFLATHDSLTGLLNRREYMRQLEQEQVRVLRQSSPLSLIMVDLDFFKKINDTHGHPAGDTVLIAVANALSQGVRKTDVLARLGGEEFIVLLPNTDLAGASGLAHKLLVLIRELKIPFESTHLCITASLGVSGLAQGAEPNPDALYAAADKALYLAKHSGRDRVELAPQHQTGAA